MSCFRVGSYFVLVVGFVRATSWMRRDEPGFRDAGMSVSASGDFSSAEELIRDSQKTESVSTSGDGSNGQKKPACEPGYAYWNMTYKEVSKNKNKELTAKWCRKKCKSQNKKQTDKGLAGYSSFTFISGYNGFNSKCRCIDADQPERLIYIQPSVSGSLLCNLEGGPDACGSTIFFPMNMSQYLSSPGITGAGSCMSMCRMYVRSLPECQSLPHQCANNSQVPPFFKFAWFESRKYCSCFGFAIPMKPPIGGKLSCKVQAENDD
mmetsp:Transcript_80092/g.162091  ORF Transcript_80092/g.162091 Transcript_80092/m.162091 type:complete len:264 (-) Transcript_80092:55-846(-)